MSAVQTAPSPDVQRLIDEGYAVTVEGGYLIVDDVPYVAAAGRIDRGALICAYALSNGVPQVGDHTVWFTGSVPCLPDGRSLQEVLIADTTSQTVAGRQVQCRFSNKPENVEEMLANFYNKLMHYIRKLTSYARVIDPNVSASGTGSFTYRQQASVFFYPNTSVAREGIDAYEAKLKLARVSIVGLGGTGSYILDALAKTPVQEIHLFDDDVVKPATGFRMPGGLAIEKAHAGMKKTDYLRDSYAVMRTGIFSRPMKVEAGNVNELDGSDFVFLAVDDGPSRGLIARHLQERGIPFIDVGLGVDKVVETTQLVGRARVTLVEDDSESVVALLPTAPDGDAAVYSNIQIVELNAMNGMLAMIKYKQMLGFYADEAQAASLKYVTSWSELRVQAHRRPQGPNDQS